MFGTIDEGQLARRKSSIK